MRLPIDAASVKSEAVGPVEADLGNIERPTGNSIDPVSSLIMSQVATARCRSWRGVDTSRVDGTSEFPIGFDQLDRPLGSNEQLLFTVLEVARSLRVSRTKVYELLYAGELASVKIGASRRVRRADLEEFVSNLDLAN